MPNAFTVKAPETLSQSEAADVLRGLNQGMRNDLSAEFTQALRARYPVEICLRRSTNSFDPRPEL